MTKHIAYLVYTLFYLFSLTVPGVAQAPLASPPPVPPVYQDIFNTLISDINAFSTTVNAGWDKSSYPVMYASQLQSAGSDLTNGLLSPNYYQYAVIGELNDLQALGVTAITFHINFPALLPSYYSDSAEYQAYLSFYTQLVSDIRGRGLKVIIENTSPTVYPGNNASGYGPYLQSLDWATYQSQRAQLAANIAQMLKPDYLVLVAEPDTEASNTGQTNAGTVSGSTQLVQGMVTAVRAASGTAAVKLGAGSGTWSPSFLQFEQSFGSLPLQFVDMHIYPVNRSYLPNALAGAQAIRAMGKEVTMSECWAYKVADSELGVLDYNTIYARDPFSFWQPVDQNFLQTLANFANYQQFSFIAPFWSHYFSAYLDYSAYGSMSSNDVISAAGNAAGAAIAVGAYTPTGNFWEGVIGPSDSTAPSVPAPPAQTGVSQTIANLTWAVASDNRGVAAYTVYRNGSPIASVNGPLSYSDSGLQPATTYSYTIAAFDAANNISQQSARTLITTLRNPDKTAPSVPSGLVASPFADTQINLTWTPSIDNVGVTGYEIYRGSSPSTLAAWGTTPVNGFLDLSAAPSTTYYYAVDAYDAFNNHSAKSVAVKATTLADTAPPTVPGSLKAVATAGPSVTLTWTASIDDWSVASYKIVRGTSPTSLVQIGSVANTFLSFIDTKAVSGKTYYYAVSASDPAKNSSPQSPVISITVP